MKEAVEGAFRLIIVFVFKWNKRGPIKLHIILLIAENCFLV